MLETCLRTIFFYFFITFSYRLMGKREIGQLGVIDFIISMLISQIVAISIENYRDSIFLAVIPIAILVILEILMAYLSMKSRVFNKVFGGKPTMIIQSGKIVYKNLISQRYSLDDLLLELRKKGIVSLEDVEYAFLEPSGDLSIFPYKPFKIKGDLPLPIIVEGTIQKDNLKYIGKNMNWVYRVLDKYQLNLKDIFYAIYEKHHIYVIRK